MTILCSRSFKIHLIIYLYSRMSSLTKLSNFLFSELDFLCLSKTLYLTTIHRQNIKTRYGHVTANFGTPHTKYIEYKYIICIRVYMYIDSRMHVYTYR